MLEDHLNFDKLKERIISHLSRENISLESLFKKHISDQGFMKIDNLDQALKELKF
jgi:hypothetical protein